MLEPIASFSKKDTFSFSILILQALGLYLIKKQ
jgi:hypothetical protein